MTLKSALANLRRRLDAFRVESLAPSLSEEEVMHDLLDHGTNRLLGRYSESQVRDAMEKYGVWAALAERGYSRPKLAIRSIDPFRQRLLIYTSVDAEEDEEHLLCELRLYDAWLKAVCPITGEPIGVDGLVIDWLVFQNPSAAFSADRPQLPGQRYPGLGIMRLSLRAIIDFARESGKEAVLNIPEYYHNAALYRNFRFFSAYVEGRFHALQQFLSDYSLSEASHLVHGERIWNVTKNEPFIWKPHEQVLPLNPRIAQYFESTLYAEKRDQAKRETKFRLR